MHIRKIELRDWKAYVSAEIEIPKPTSERNVVLIGARNGFGKTSLFEAIVLGLLGSDGLGLIARAPFGLEVEDRLKVSYDGFLSKALHKEALLQGRQQMSVTLHFEDNDGEPLRIRRIWHFSSGGIHKRADEDFQVYRGINNKAINAPKNDDEIEWRRSFVARELLPSTLASFFLFDGEQVQVLAERDMSAQIATGIRGLLGIQVLQELAGDLKKYANTRRGELKGGSPKELDRIRNDLLRLEHEVEVNSKNLSNVEEEHGRLQTRRDVLTQELSGLGATTGETTLKERHEELNGAKRTLENLRDRLQKSLIGDLALALAGSSLRKAVCSRLVAEDTREKWESGKSQSEGRLQPFLENMNYSIMRASPALNNKQQEVVLEAVKSNWEQLWHPAPDGVPDGYRHPFVAGGERERVIEKLKSIDRTSSAEVSEVLDEIAKCERSEHALENEIAQIEGIAPQIKPKIDELKDLNHVIDKFGADRARLKRECEVLAEQARQKRAEHQRYVELIDKAGPSVRRAAWADKVAAAIEEITEEAVPGQIGAVAAKMTEAFKAMAHKRIVDRVEIAEDCTVRLLSASGEDVRDRALSAGEQQIFAQSLISAIAKVSQRDFPIIVDTPLGRLDDAHREGVLNYFTKHEGQVILLSTDTEIFGRYLELVKPRLSATFHITHEHQGGTGVSTVSPGYFPGTGA